MQSFKNNITASGLLALLFAVPSLHGAEFQVNIDTAPLSGPQTLAFSLTDGDGTTDNLVTLSNFSFGGGNPLGTPTYSGSGITGDLTSGVSITDADFLELFMQEFQPGSLLSFDLMTTNAFAGGTPDGFLVYLCDASFSNCYSDDSSTGAMLALQLTGTPLTEADFVLNAASAQGLAAPSVASVPEPRLSLIAGLIGCALALRSRKRARS